MLAPDAIPTELSTPILDSGELPPLPQTRTPSTIRGMLTLIGGLIVVLPVIAWTDKSKRPGNAFLLLVCALALTILVHEIGHLTAGWMVGLRFNAIRIGPLSLSVEHGRLKMRVRRETLAGGAAGMYGKTVRRLRRRMLFFVAGGPAANAISVPTVVVLVNHVFPQFADTALGALAAQFTVLSLIAALGNLAPIRSGIVVSDGVIIEMLLRSRSRCRRWLSIFGVWKQYAEGVRPRDWKRTWVRAAASVRDISLDALSGNWLAYMSASDRKDERDAAFHLERCLELTAKMPVFLRDLVAQEAAFFSGWFRLNAALADNWSAQVKKPRLLHELVQIRLKVAIACAHGDFEAADLAWQKGIAFIETATAGSAKSNLRESWLEWREEIQERKQKPSALADG